jgi:hypothetical protein
MPTNERCHAKDAVELLQERTIATLEELKEALGTRVDVTVFRKLKPLGYRSSYSHRGKYYTLDSIADFDERGLWSFHEVGFSKRGTLLATAEHFVLTSQAGCLASELKDTLNVGVKEALLKLVQQGRIARERSSGLYLYCSPQAPKRNRQLMARRLQEAQTGFSDWAESDETKAAIVLFAGLLNERQRRLYAGLESLKLGYGGDSKVAAVTGMSVHTVARGRRELAERDVVIDGVRKAGAGRKRVEKKRLK